MELQALLTGVAALLSDPANWTQGANARDAEGIEVEPWNERAVKWCLYGACAKVLGTASWTSLDGTPYPMAVSALDDAAHKEHGSGALFVNDGLGHDAMLELLKETQTQVAADPSRYESRPLV